MPLMTRVSYISVAKFGFGDMGVVLRQDFSALKHEWDCRYIYCFFRLEVHLFRKK